MTKDLLTIQKARIGAANTALLGPLDLSIAAGEALALFGPNGAGKTTLVRGTLEYLGWKDVVTSPTYTLCEEYEIDDKLLLHVDLYRIEIQEDVEVLNLDRETFNQKITYIK